MKIITFLCAGIILAGCAHQAKGSGIGQTQQTKELPASDNNPPLGLTADSLPKSAKGTCPVLAEHEKIWLLREELKQRIQRAVDAGNEKIVVRYRNCRLEVLDNCHLKDRYETHPEDRTNVTERMYRALDLERIFKVEAPFFKEQFALTKPWIFDALFNATVQSRRNGLGKKELPEACQDATHFVRSIRLGAAKVTGEKDGKKQIVGQSGAYEQCLMSQRGIEDPKCRVPVEMELIQVAKGSALPVSTPHHLLEQIPGTERVQRIETGQFGRPITVPEKNKVTVLAFWSAPENADPTDEPDGAIKMLGELDELKKRLEKLDFLVVGIALRMSSREAKTRLKSLVCSFPLAADGERRLQKRYHLDAESDAIFILDKQGRLKYFTHAESVNLDEIEAVISALAN